MSPSTDTIRTSCSTSLPDFYVESVESRVRVIGSPKDRTTMRKIIMVDRIKERTGQRRAGRSCRNNGSSEHDRKA